MPLNSEERTSVPPMSEDTFARAANAIRKARSLIVTSGAGMGVDSGLPSFRDDNGFWNAYPAYEKLGIKFMEMSTPRHLTDDPTMGWGFFGHRANMYRDAVPHVGFELLMKWIKRFDLQYFVVTSNVDGQFQKAGFDEERVEEVHGSIHYMQCHKPCQPHIWKHREEFNVDTSTMRSAHVPTCIHCGELARPNILMFNDWWFIPTRSNAQNRQFKKFIQDCPQPMVVIEIGAGKSIPTIRYISESIARDQDATVIRINTSEAQIAAPHISIPMGGAAALKRIQQYLDDST